MYTPNHPNFKSSSSNQNHSTSTGDSLIANLKGALSYNGKNYLPPELRIDFQTMNFLDPILVDNILYAFQDNGLMGYIGGRYKGFSVGDLYWLLGKFTEIYPRHPRIDEIKKDRDVIVKRLTQYLSYRDMQIHLSPNHSTENKRKNLQKIDRYITRNKIIDITEINKLVDEFARFKRMYMQQSNSSFLASLSLSLSNSITDKDKIQLLAMIDANTEKDWTRNMYDGIVLQKERDYGLDLHDDIPTIVNRFHCTEKFKDNYDFGQENVTLEIKKIMVHYGLGFMPAFLIYRIEFLKKHESEYFAKSPSVVNDTFSQTQNYNSYLPKDELIALRQYQTGFASMVNNGLRMNHPGNIVSILTNKVSSVINKNTLKVPTTLYRMIYREGVKLWENKKEGDTITDLGFVSTSHTEDFWKNHIKDYKGIVLKINAPIGTPYVNMEEHFCGGSVITGGYGAKTYYYTGQDEILLQKGTRFQINKIYPNEDGEIMYEVNIV